MIREMQVQLTEAQWRSLEAEFKAQQGPNGYYMFEAFFSWKVRKAIGPCSEFHVPAFADNEAGRLSRAAWEAGKAALAKDGSY